MSSKDNVDMVSDEAERLRKEAKKAKKAAKRKAEGEVESSPEPSASPVATVDLDDAERREKKRVKKEAKEAAASSASSSSAPASSEFKPSAGASSASPMTAARKNFYQQHSEVSSMTKAQVDAVRGEVKMTISGEMYGKESLYNPVTGFHQCGYSKHLLKCTEGFKAPTGIQAQCWPVLLMGRDAIAIAETGSGKTLGFMLPALVHILDAKPIDTAKKGRSVDNMGPVALILAPTRELAMQSAEVAENASKNVGLITACVYGGVERHVQRSAIAKGVHVMVACPGRLLSLIKDGEISLSRVSFLVLDEADRMLDMGFEPDIRAIVGYCPGSQTRQTLMFSATWPETVKALASSFIVDPIRITIGKDESELANDTLAANKRITQTVEVLEEFKRDARLLELLAHHTKGAVNGQHKKILVFVLYKKEVDRVERTLRQKGFQAVGMSSDKGQADRTAAIENFKSGKVRLLVATDVAGRGLDINDIALVINYSFPLTVEDYVHRIGRTGRGGKSGESITFFTKNDKHLSGELINVMREANANVPEDLMKFGTGVKKKTHGMYGAFYKPQDNEQPMKKAVKITFDD
jgi:ATP-dependent RNA helicase DBP3